MEISYIGHSCFRIKGKELTIIIDPYDPKMTGYKFPKQECDLLLVTHHHHDHDYIEGVSGYKLLIDNPGEYETSDVFVYGMDTAHDESGGGKRGKNTIYLIEIDGFSILHLGDLGHELSAETLEKISDVDILMIPVGGTYTIDAKTATKIISSLEPGIVIPMHYKTDGATIPNLDGVDKFLDEMGEDEKSVRVEEKLKVSSKSDIPEDTEVVILTPNH